MNPEDLFQKMLQRCTSCGATEGHFISCPELEVEQIKRRGVCPVCRCTYPCYCDAPDEARQ